MSRKVLIVCPMGHIPSAIRLLQEDGFIVSYRPELPCSELLQEIADADALIPNLTQRIDASVLDAAKQLKLIATPSTGTDHIDLPYASGKGVDVLSLKGDLELLETIPSTAEQAFLLMMAVFRNFYAAVDSVRKGQWLRDNYRGYELMGKKVGVVGYGRLGKMFAKYCDAFGMQVLACDPHVVISDAWVEQLSLDELLSHSDAISLHVHLNDDTRGMIGHREFSLMREGVVLINTSRGGLIDESSFLHALKSRKVKAAGIDVLGDELDGNVSNLPLVQYANENDHLMITPHVGGCTYEAQEKSYCWTANKIIKYFQTAS